MLVIEMIVNTDSNGHINFNFPAKLNVPVGNILSATATDLITGDTSEFSPFVNVDAKGSPTAYESANGASGGGNNKPIFDNCLDPTSA
jgi:hypothetical protein